MLVVLRFRVDPAGIETFREQAATALQVLAACPGWRSSRVARAVDDDQLWTVTTEWDGVGAYRRALSSYDVKLSAVPFLSGAIDEPSAFEVVEAHGSGAEGLATGSGRADEPPVERW